MTQPPVEALQMARMLADSSGRQPSDLEKRIQEVLSVVPGRSSEEANIALHDNDYDLEKAISALLDSDTGTGTVSGRGGLGVGVANMGVGDISLGALKHSY